MVVCTKGDVPIYASLIANNKLYVVKIPKFHLISILVTHITTQDLFPLPHGEAIKNKQIFHILS
jgi:hypothetical protein